MSQDQSFGCWVSLCEILESIFTHPGYGMQSVLSEIPICPNSMLFQTAKQDPPNEGSYSRDVCEQGQVICM